MEGRAAEPVDEDQEVEERVRRERDSSESSDEDEQPSKCSKGHLDTSKFPWHEKHVNAIATLSPDIKQTFDQLERFSVNPKGVVRDILSTPGCPPFPPEQWLNIVQWKVIDLAKVLEAVHSTDLEPKQMHVIDDKVELSFRASKSTVGIHSASDHNIAFTKYINMLTFVFPQHWEEYTSWNAHMLSAPWSHSNNTFTSLIIPHLANSNTPSCPPLVWVPIPPNQVLVEEGSQIGQVEEERNENLATSGIGARVPNLPPSITSRTAVTGKVVKELTRNQTVLTLAKPVKDPNSVIATSPRYRQKNIWNGHSHPQSPTALWTETAVPLPHPPAHEFQNSFALHTISDNSHLFHVSTCININEFESLLSDHPNPAFVCSVCVGLREGFWPFADTHFRVWPLTHDNSFHPLNSAAEKDFIKTQINKEVELG
ncbi:hypothetical protein EDB19DRAFT_1914664 [Suillus lakei]|nr:hypothetical protein EDB19DRAFT_1914664 [Suillus lakei]